VIAHRRTWTSAASPLGREDECRTLDEFLGPIREGLSRALVVSGEAGIGKTRLLQYAADAADGFLLATADGAESERPQGFSGLHRLLLPFLDRVGRLPAPQRDALSTAFGLATGPPADRFRVGLGALTLLAEIAAEQPLLCIVDDVQWLDRESLQALSFVARRLQADGVGLLFGLRDGPREEEATTLLDGVPVLALGGLNPLPARALLARTVSEPIDESVVDRVVAETGGNPLALIELTGGLTGEQLAGRAALPVVLPAGPQLEAHFLRRVQLLPPPAQDLLLLASAASPDDPAVFWRAVERFGLVPGDADPAVAERILVLGPEIQFRHPLIRSAVYGGADAGRRRRAHEVLAAVTDRGHDPDRRAWHRAAAALGPDESVAVELEQAAERARGRGGYSAQAAFLRRSAELSPSAADRAERLLAAARAYLVAGDRANAQSLLDQVTPELTGTRAQARAVRMNTTIMVAEARLNQAPVTLLDAAATLGDDDPALSRDLLHDALESALMARQGLIGTTTEAVAAAVLERSGSSPASGGVREQFLEAFAVREVEGYAPAVARLRAATTRLEAGAELDEVGIPLAVLVSMASDETWDGERRRPVLERLESFDREHGALAALRITLYSLAMCDLWDGRFTDAAARYAESTDLAVALGYPHDDAVNQVELMAWRGEEAVTRQLAEVGLRVYCEQLGIWSALHPAVNALSILELSLGHYRQALEHARASFETEGHGYGHRVLPNLIEAAVRSGDRATAEAGLARLTERTTASGTTWALGVLAVGRALLADDTSAEAFHLEALDHLGRTSIVTERARAHLLYGEWLRHRHRSADARRELRTAHTLFSTMGAIRFAERARVGLRATGEQGRLRTTEAGLELTAQEARIARLAAGGATNSEIAGRLYVTASTVEYHLNKVFRKLGLTSRRQLAQALGVVRPSGSG